MRVKVNVVKKQVGNKITIILFLFLCVITFLSINMYRNQSEFSLTSEVNQAANQTTIEAKYQEVMEEEAEVSAIGDNLEIE